MKLTRLSHALCVRACACVCVSLCWQRANEWVFTCLPSSSSASLAVCASLWMKCESTFRSSFRSMPSAFHMHSTVVQTTQSAPNHSIATPVARRASCLALPRLSSRAERKGSKSNRSRSAAIYSILWAMQQVLAFLDEEDVRLAPSNLQVPPRPPPSHSHAKAFIQIANDSQRNVYSLQFEHLHCNAAEHSLRY